MNKGIDGKDLVVEKAGSLYDKAGDVKDQILNKVIDGKDLVVEKAG